MLDLPPIDFDKALSMHEAGRALVRRRVHDALSGGPYTPPEPFDDLRDFLEYVADLRLHCPAWWTPRQKQMLRWFARDITALVVKSGG